MDNLTYMYILHPLTVVKRRVKILKSRSCFTSISHGMSQSELTVTQC